MTVGFNEGVLPRELVPGIHWLGECYAMPFQGEMLHAYDSLFVLEGTDAVMIVEGGMSIDAPTNEAQLEECLAKISAPVRYICVSHTEIPHAGGLGRLMERFPDAVMIGDTRDYHLFLPQFDGRFQWFGPGDVLDLGGLTFRGVAPIIKDMRSTLWGYVPERGALFSADGFCYAHIHRADQCGKVASEVPELAISEQGGLFIEMAANWMTYVDVEPLIVELEQLIEDLQVTLVCPTHGLPITDVPAAMGEVYAGIRSVRADAKART